MGATHTGVTLESLEFHRGSGTYRARYDEETTAASIAAVTEVLDADPVDLTPLYDTVDTDELVDGGTAPDDRVHTSFPFEDHEIGVSSDGVVAVTPLSPADDGDGDR